MSHSVYYLRAVFAVMEPRQWESAISYLQKEQEASNTETEQFNIYRVLINSLEEAYDSEQTVCFIEISESEDDPFLHDYVCKPFPAFSLELFDTINDKLWKLNKSLYLSSIEIDNTVAEPQILVKYYVGSYSQLKEIKNYYIEQDWSSVRGAFISCGIRYSKPLLEFTHDFPDKEFNFIREKYKEYEVYTEIGKYVVDASTVLIPGKKFFFRYIKNLEKDRNVIIQVGGEVQKSITNETDYVVIENDYDATLKFLTNENKTLFSKMKQGQKTRFVRYQDFQKKLGVTVRQKIVEDKRPLVEEQLKKIFNAYQNEVNKPTSINQIKEGHPEIDFRVLDNVFSQLYQKTLSVYLREQGVLAERENNSTNSNKSYDFDGLIKILQEKYSDHYSRKQTVKELIEDNPELESEIKVLQRKSTKLYGKSLSMLLIEKNILKGFE